MTTDLDTAGEAARPWARVLALALSLWTLLTFGFALWAVPVSGANAPGGGIPYPYLDTLGQYPRDFLWQYLALVQVGLVLGFFTVMKVLAAPARRLAAETAHSLALAGGTILGITYYTQLAVVPSSLAAGETQGLALVIQYNPHGLFIAGEELGWLLVLGALTASAGTLGPPKGAALGLRLVTYGAAAAAVLSLAGLSLVYGLDRQDRWEVILISLVWLTLIADGLLAARLLGRSRASTVPRIR